MLDDDTVLREHAEGNEEPLQALASAVNPTKRDDYVKQRLCVDNNGSELYVFEMQTGGVYALEAQYIMEQARKLRDQGVTCELTEAGRL